MGNVKRVMAMVLLVALLATPLVCWAGVFCSAHPDAGRKSSIVTTGIVPSGQFTHIVHSKITVMCNECDAVLNTLTTQEGESHHYGPGSYIGIDPKTGKRKIKYYCPVCGYRYIALVNP